MDANASPWQPLVAQDTVPIVMVGDIPIVIPLPDAPAIPLAGPVVTYVGKGVQAAWSDVWGYLKGAARNTASDVINGVEAVVPQIEKYVEAYVGETLKAVSGFINEAFDYTSASVESLAGITGLVAAATLNAITHLDETVYGLLADVGNIVGVTVPWLEYDIGLVEAAAFAEAHTVGLDVEQWTVDHVLNPVLEDIYAEGVRVGVYVDDAIAAATASILDVVNSDIAEKLAGLGVLTGLITMAATWIEECGAPMCENMGPTTDIFKLLKALAVAGDLALLGELLSLDKAGVEDRLHEAIGVMGTIINDFDQFVTGGETIGGFLGKVASLT